MKNNIFIKWILTFILVISICFSTVNVVVDAETNVELKTYVGKVIEVIDGEAFRIKVIDPPTGELLQVRLVGIKTNASKEAYDYVYSKLNNNIIILKLEDRLIDNAGQWKYGYAIRDNHYINDEMLSRGIADIDDKFEDFNRYKELKAKYDYAKENKIGLWSELSVYNPYEPKVNINTANSSELYSLLEDTDMPLAQRIVSYRKENYFNTKDELKFVDDKIDEKWLERNNSRITLVTNLNTAEEYELKSLFSNTGNLEQITTNIIEYRMNHEFKEKQEVTKVDKVYKTMYKKFENFVSVGYEKEYKVKPEIVVNINTASESQLDAIKLLSKARASAIVRYKRKDKYSYKTFGELGYVVPVISDFNIDQIEDNLVLKTDINTANDKELESLFGKFKLKSKDRDKLIKKIKEARPYKNMYHFEYIISSDYYKRISKYVYIDKPFEDDKININLATVPEMVEHLGITKEDASKLYEERKKKPFTNYYKLPMDLSKYDEKITLFTNINVASKVELLSLDKRLTLAVVNKIIEYRDKQRFANQEEFKRFMIEHKAQNVFTKISQYIVFR